MRIPRRLGIAALFAVACALPCSPARAQPGPPQPAPPAPGKPGLLRVSENRRFLVREDGSPFFYLGDTAWELFHRLTREEAGAYLQDRARKGFTVVQAVVLAEFAGLSEGNAYGDKPLIDGDLSKPNEKYFRHVDDVVDAAAALGLYVGMLPTWGDKVNKKWGEGPEIFTPANAGAWGEFLGKRYKDKPILWVFGGDRPIDKPGHLEVWRAMAAGVRRGDGGRHLITFHPMGGHSSAEWLHDEPWLDFNMIQSGHGKRDGENYKTLARDYARAPAKPVLDAESNYEDHPINWKPENGWFDDYDVRKLCYWGLFAGACGTTYGCHDIWQFLSDKHKPVSSSRTPWTKALDFPGSTQVGYARRLMEARPYLSRVPDQDLIAGADGKGGDHVAATRAADGSYAMVYLPAGKPVTVDLSKLSGEKVKASWFDPRDGKTTPAGEFAREGRKEFVPPRAGERANDWVLVLDDAGKHYPAP